MSNQRNTNANHRITERLKFWGQKWEQAKQDAELERLKQAELFGDPTAPANGESKQANAPQQKTARQQAIESQVTSIVQAHPTSNNKRLHQWADYLNVTLWHDQPQPQQSHAEEQQTSIRQKCNVM